MYYVYTFVSEKDNKFYTGYTSDLKRRVQRHRYGEVEATRHRRPLKLVYYEGFLNIKDAKAREKYLKSGYGRDQLREILKDTLNNV
jgi:putative endonuclease